MIAKLHIPAPPLDRFVESFFYYTGFQPEHAVDRFIPDGNVYMIFDLTDRPKYIYDNHTLKEIQSCKRVWFSGFRTEPITIPSGAESEMIVVNFHKGKAFPFPSLPLGEVTNCDQTFKLWNLTTGQCTLTFHGFDDVIYTTRFLSEHEFFLGTAQGRLFYYNFHPHLPGT